MLKECLENVRKTVPLVHNITNYVTVNDVANVLLACGGSPIMSDEAEDVEDITSVCGGLNINIGTLHKTSIEGMFRAGKKANELGHPVLLDPVGAGASALRTNTALELMKELRLAVIRGNISEIKTLALGSGTTKGVDADVADAVTEENLDDAAEFVKEFARKTGSIIAVTGAIDLVSDGEKCYVIRNGRPRDGKDHRDRMPAVRHDDRLCDCESREPSGSSSSGSVCDGAGRRDRMGTDAGRRR